MSLRRGVTTMLLKKIIFFNSFEASNLLGCILAVATNSKNDFLTAALNMSMAVFWFILNF